MSSEFAALQNTLMDLITLGLSALGWTAAVGGLAWAVWVAWTDPAIDREGQ